MAVCESLFIRIRNIGVEVMMRKCTGTNTDILYMESREGMPAWVKAYPVDVYRLSGLTFTG